MQSQQSKAGISRILPAIHQLQQFSAPLNPASGHRSNVRSLTLETHMGMFDEIRCEAPLPDAPAPAEVWFQTKSFPDPCMCRYTITRDGRLIDSRGNDLEPEGYVIFYTLDEVTSGDRQWREYRAQFVAGRLGQIVQVADGDPGNRYYGLASFRWHNSPSFMFGDPDAEDV